MEIRVKANDDAVINKLQQLINSAESPEPAMASAGRKLQSLIQLGFRSGVSPDGLPWRSLSLRSGQPLVDTGRLRRSITYAARGDSVQIGTNVAYARVHQYGAVITPKTAQLLRFMGPLGPVFAKKVTIPARPFLPLEGDQISLPGPWAKSVLAAIAAHFDKAIKK